MPVGEYCGGRGWGASVAGGTAGHSIEQASQTNRISAYWAEEMRW